MKATPKAASQVDSKPRAMRGKRSLAQMEGQLDLFASFDDPVSVVAIADALVNQREHTEAAIAASDDVAQAVAAAGHANVDFARYMVSSGVPAETVMAELKAEGADIDAVFAGLDAVVEIDRPAGDFEGASASFDAGPPVAEARSGATDYTEDEESEDKPAKAAAEDTKGASSTQLYVNALRGKRFDPPTPEREAELGRRSMAGDVLARSELVERNMRFVVAIARRYIKTGRPFDDLIQAGAEGLMAAAEKFDPSKARFTTLAGWWITQRIQRVVRKDDNMPIPAYLPFQEAKLLRQAEAATSEEERNALKAKAADAKQRLEARRKPAVSMDQSISGEEDGGELHELLGAEAPGHEERVEQMQLVRKLVEFASRLGDDRATNIFLMRTGMHPEHLGEIRTLQEISEVVSMSRERVRQIYVEAAEDIATAMEYWARGPENLPDGFRRGLLNPGRN